MRPVEPLLELFVEPPLWRRGYGKALIAYCIDAARQRGARALHVIGNPHAEAFYRSCGFALVGTEPTRFGPGLLMRVDCLAEPLKP